MEALFLLGIHPPLRYNPPSSLGEVPVEKQYIVTVGFRAKPGKAAALEKMLRDRVPISRTEAGNLDYRLYRSRTDSDVFFLFSRFTSEKMFDVHLYQPYTLSLYAGLEDVLVDQPRVETYDGVIG